jgi:hypothetical protein
MGGQPHAKCFCPQGLHTRPSCGKSGSGACVPPMGRGSRGRRTASYLCIMTAHDWPTSHSSWAQSPRPAPLDQYLTPPTWQPPKTNSHPSISNLHSSLVHIRLILGVELYVILRSVDIAARTAAQGTPNGKLRLSLAFPSPRQSPTTDSPW